MPNTLTITRSQSGGIALDEWKRYVAASAMIRPIPPKEGANPFTKQPTLFHPPPGAAAFETSAGRCSIEYREGTLIVSGSIEQGMPMLTEIARAMSATITTDA
jgi:hypothetical protein